MLLFSSLMRWNQLKFPAGRLWAPEIFKSILRLRLNSWYATSIENNVVQQKARVLSYTHILTSKSIRLVSTLPCLRRCFVSVVILFLVFLSLSFCLVFFTQPESICWWCFCIGYKLIYISPAFFSLCVATNFSRKSIVDLVSFNSTQLNWVEFLSCLIFFRTIHHTNQAQLYNAPNERASLIVLTSFWNRNEIKENKTISFLLLLLLLFETKQRHKTQRKKCISYTNCLFLACMSTPQAPLCSVALKFIQCVKLS